MRQLDLHPLLRDPRQLARHRRHGRDDPRRRGEVELGDEPRRAQHPQRIVGERLLGRGRGVQRAGGERGEATVRVDEAPVPLDLATGQLDGHRVDREVAPDQVVLDRLTEGDDRVAAHAVVRVGPERGDLDGRAVPARADRPERDPRVPDRLGPALEQGEHRWWVGVGGEVEVGLLAVQQGVADAATDEVEPVSGRGEPGRELVGDRVDRHEVHRRILLRTYELGGDGGERHGESV